MLCPLTSSHGERESFIGGTGDDHARLRQRPEAVDVEAFVADAVVERFDVAPGFAGWDEVQADLAG
jgi:hypothetical protein